MYDTLLWEHPGPTDYRSFDVISLRGFLVDGTVDTSSFYSQETPGHD